MARLYSNENFPRQAVEALRLWGHDVLTVLEAGHAEQAISDAEVLAFATRENRLVLTLNRKHFIRLHQETPTHAGIIVCTFDPDFTAQAQRIHALLQAHPDVSNLLCASTARRANPVPRLCKGNKPNC